MPATKSVGWAGAGAWLAAGGVWASWACCSLPIAAGAAGLGLGALGAALTPWRPYLIGLSLALAAFALFVAYRPPPARGAACAPHPHHRVRLVAWITALATVILVTLPLWQTLWAAR
ncbi:MAG: mercuric transporter MerT family protein [Terriglobales bacterium]